MESNGNEEIIDLWTSEFLKDCCRTKSAVTTGAKQLVAFGRTTHQKDTEGQDQLMHLSRPRTTPHTGRGRKPRVSLFTPTKLSDARIQETNEHKTRIAGQQSKVRGTQMLNFKIDFSKAREKRKRQLQYSREIKSGAKSLHMREIDSVTRLVVQNFKKLIDCERCALFLMDESKNELYFKPVGDSDHSHARLKEIRFPASSGVAGWVASNKILLNIKNAYHDSRFNAEIGERSIRTSCTLSHATSHSLSHSYVFTFCRQKDRFPN